MNFISNYFNINLHPRLGSFPPNLPIQKEILASHPIKSAPTKKDRWNTSPQLVLLTNLYTTPTHAHTNKERIPSLTSFPYTKIPEIKK